MRTKQILTMVGIGLAVPLAYWLVSPLFITREVHEAPIESGYLGASSGVNGAPAVPGGEQSPEPVIVGQGSFESLAGHNATGTATLVKVGQSYAIRFEDDFRITNGPDLFVYLGSGDSYDSNARLAALKGTAGSQNYAVPDILANTPYTHVWVWCRAFSVPFGKASLAAFGGGGGDTLGL